MYAERLSEVMNAQLSMFEQDKAELDNAANRLEDAAREFDQLKGIDSMFGGETDVAIRDAASKLTRVIEQTQATVMDLQSATETGRSSIQAAQSAFLSLPSSQPNAWEKALGLAVSVMVPGVGIMAGDAFLTWVTGQREAERERAALAALNQLRSDMSGYETQLPEYHSPDLNGKDRGRPVPPPTPPTPPSPPGQRPGPDGNSGGGSNGGGYNNPGAGQNVPLSPAERVQHAIDKGMNAVRYDEAAGVQSGGYPGVIPPKSPLPSTDQWPFDVYHPGDINRDGPLQGGYRVNLDPAQGVMPRDPMLRSTIAEGNRLLGGNLGALGVAGGALGAGALAAGAARGGMAVSSGPLAGPMAAGGAARGGMGVMGGMAGAPGAAGAANSGRGGAGRGGLGAGAGRGGMGAGAGAGRGGMMGGMTGGAPASAANDKKNAKGGKTGLGGARGGAGRGGLGAGAGRGGMGAGAGAGRGGMMGGMAGGAPASAANDKKNAKGGKAGLGSGARGGGAGAGAGRGGAGGAGGRAGMMGGMAGGAGRASDEEKKQQRTTYGPSGVEFFDLADEQQLGAAGRSGKVNDKVIKVVEQDDSRW